MFSTDIQTILYKTFFFYINRKKVTVICANMNAWLFELICNYFLSHLNLINSCGINRKFFISHSIFIKNINFLQKFLKFVFKAFYSDQAFWDFIETCSTFSVVCKKRLVNKSFEFLGIEK